MITLCVECFPGWGDVEVLTIDPGLLTACDQCGRSESKRHLFRRDPRPVKSELPPASDHTPYWTDFRAWADPLGYTVPEMAKAWAGYSAGRNHSRQLPVLSDEQILSAAAKALDINPSDTQYQFNYKQLILFGRVMLVFLKS